MIIEDSMSDGEVIASLQQLLECQRTLVLGTADTEPWVAPVYYVYRNRRCYFFSNATSRHIVATQKTGLCAASVFREGDNWRDLEGVQMEGRVEHVPVGAEALAMLPAYVKKFPTVKDLFAEQVLDFRLFTQRFRAQLYAFVPQRVYYLNNQLGFGERRQIAWDVVCT